MAISKDEFWEAWRGSRCLDFCGKTPAGVEKHVYRFFDTEGKIWKIVERLFSPPGLRVVREGEYMSRMIYFRCGKIRDWRFDPIKEFDGDEAFIFEMNAEKGREYA